MLVRFECNNSDCTNSITKLFKNFKEIPCFLNCGECGTGKLERILGAPSNHSTQIVDNGNQAKAVTVMNEVVLKEQERLYREED